jgi:hypothetical protein
MPFSQGHALLIGVGTHQHCPWLDAPVTAADAEAVAAVLQDGDACGYPAGQVQVITHGGATKTGILAALDDLAGRTRAGDTVFLFFCGHGALGTDGSYHLGGHDVQIESNRIRAGTGVSEAELRQKLRAIVAERVLIVVDAHHSAGSSPVRQAGGSATPPSLITGNPPEDTVAALLGTGKGRIIVVACRPEQRSHAGSGPLSIFAQALVDGLRGNGVADNRGFIGVFSLYEQLYTAVIGQARAHVNEAQEPELTVLRGAGSFAVALYKGAGAGDAELAAEPLPQGMAVREISPKEGIKDLPDFDDSDFVIGNIRK